MTKKIASIYFCELHAERPLYGGKFDIPAVAKGSKPVIIEVRDHVQMEQQPHIAGGGKIPRQIAGEEIAADLVKTWAGNALGMTGECGPGVWVVRDTIPELDPDGKPQFDQFRHPIVRPATDEERSTMWAEDITEQKARQDRWIEHNIQRGDILSEDPKQRVWITKTMKAACIHAGRKRKWLEDIKAEDTKTCPFCRESVVAEAVKCPKCHEVIDFDRYAAFEAQKNQALAKANKGVITPPVAKSA